MILGEIPFSWDVLVHLGQSGALTGVWDSILDVQAMFQTHGGLGVAGQDLAQGTPKRWILADCAAPGELTGEAQNAQTGTIPWENLQMFALLLEPWLEGHCHCWDTEKPPGRAGTAPRVSRADSSRQNRASRAGDGPWHCPDHARGLGSWGIASCSQGTFWDV